MAKRSGCPDDNKKINPVTGDESRKGGNSVDSDEIPEGTPGFGAERDTTVDTGPDSTYYEGV